MMQTHIYLNSVAVDRAADFEKCLSETVEPILQQNRPDLVGRYSYLKATEPDSGQPAVVTYAFIFDGGSLEDDWELHKLLSPQYGDEQAEALLREWAETFVPLDQWLAALGDRAGEIGQIGWTFEAVGPTRQQVG
jgi:hypothetical protein